MGHRAVCCRCQSKGAVTRTGEADLVHLGLHTEYITQHSGVHIWLSRKLFQPTMILETKPMRLRAGFAAYLEDHDDSTTCINESNNNSNNHNIDSNKKRIKKHIKMKRRLENQAKADRGESSPHWPCAKPNQDIASIQNSSLTKIRSITPYMLMTHNPLCITKKHSRKEKKIAKRKK